MVDQVVHCWHHPYDDDEVPQDPQHDLPQGVARGVGLVGRLWKLSGWLLWTGGAGCVGSSQWGLLPCVGLLCAGLVSRCGIWELPSSLPSKTSCGSCDLCWAKASNFWVTLETRLWVLAWAIASANRGLARSVAADEGSVIVGSTPRSTVVDGLQRSWGICFKTSCFLYWGFETDDIVE